jgi:hypothetical protein
MKIEKFLDLNGSPIDFSNLLMISSGKLTVKDFSKAVPLSKVFITVSNGYNYAQMSHNLAQLEIKDL